MGIKLYYTTVTASRTVSWVDLFTEFPVTFTFLAPWLAVVAVVVDNAGSNRHTQRPISNSFLLTNGALGLCSPTPIDITRLTSALAGRGRNRNSEIIKLSLIGAAQRFEVAKSSHGAR